MELAGRVALVTGAGQRLGSEFARALAGRGMVLALHFNRSADGAEALRDEIRAAGGKAEVFQADLTDADAAQRLAPAAAASLGGLDVLVNSAAVMYHISFENTSVAQYDEVLDLNLRSPFFVAQGAAPMLRRARGRIVNIADLGGLEPWPGYAAHSVAKAGVVMLTKVLARALAPEVNVNAIAPGTVLVPDTYSEAERSRLADNTPLKRLGTPSDAVNALLYLLEGGDFVTGEILVVDGGRLLR
ncbi:MAG TPA: SDR family oxidoreductase [Gemmatimonadales bacterium]|nr:SDR family oxidoreductase [Gemmatimonadales bacterium]